MNKFMGRKLIINKWLTQSQARVLDPRQAWTIFEKGYLQRSVEECEKICRVKEDLLVAAKTFTVAVI